MGPLPGPVQKRIEWKNMIHESDEHRLEALYDEYFAVIPANSPELLEEAYALRYQVYCLEHAFEDPSAHSGEREVDEFDKHSVHAVLIFKPTARVVGCVRLVLPTGGRVPASLPIRDLLSEQFRARLDECPPLKTAEISRYAVSKMFRRREGETLYPDVGFFDLNASDSRRLAPHISLGLVRAVGKLAFDHGITHVCAAMAPALLRLLGRFGLSFELLGPPVEYHGLRQPCLAECERLLTGMSRQNADYHRLAEAAYHRGQASAVDLVEDGNGNVIS